MRTQGTHQDTNGPPFFFHKKKVLARATSLCFWRRRDDDFEMLAHASIMPSSSSKTPRHLPTTPHYYLHHDTNAHQRHKSATLSKADRSKTGAAA
jgi:hypothetical protein